VDRCALFVDASYVLADGAMAVHGTRRGESVSWDYEGLLRLLFGLARDRTGLPLLRCYWYEATVDGRRTAEQDALADVPGIKLRVAKIRPGRREGVETEIHRDLTTLARNNAITDALVMSAEEDLAQVVADVQDLGMRVTLMHIAVDGNWTISRALRQESDDIIEIGREQLRPFVKLIAGAEPAHADEQDDAGRTPGRTLANGHSAVVGVGSYQQLPANHAPPSIYTAPAVAEYRRPAQELPRTAARDDRPRENRPRDDRPREDRPREDRAAPAANGEVQPSARPDMYAGAEAAPATSGQLRRLPSRSASSGPMAAVGPMGSTGVKSAPGQHARPSPGVGRSDSYSGPQPVATSVPAAGPGYQAAGTGGGVSLAEAVQAAHEEGQEFGASVARDAPALWLEAVLARKPRMPSDLEARLLQGSALPIDFLLHDEVRHALRRGFWDALERTRR
jgi:NYN domain